MSVEKPSMSRSYRPWGQVRRKNLIARVLYGMVMTVAGLGLIAALVLTAVFAASLLLVGAAVVAVLAAIAVVRRKPVRIFVRSAEAKATDSKGVMEARSDGSTWTVY